MAVFVTVAEEESFSKAGRKLGLATSSVSRSINRLERSLQTKLLERTTRKVRLSTAGSEVYEQCKQMLESAKSAVQVAHSNLEEARGVLRIAAPKAFAKQILSPLVLDFLQTYSGVTVKFRVADHFIDPVSEDVDVIFRLTDQPLEGLISKTLMQTNLVLCATPVYLEIFGVPAHPGDLLDHQCITLDEQTGDNEWKFTNEQQKVKIKTQSRFSVNHTEIRKDAVLRNLGISIFPDFTVESELRDGTLVAVLPDWHVAGNYQGKVILQYAQSRFIPIQIRKFVDFMAERFASL
nr:LysR family transcriptional regulator [Amphritea pacifica]